MIRQSVGSAQYWQLLRRSFGSTAARPSRKIVPQLIEHVLPAVNLLVDGNRVPGRFDARNQAFRIHHPAECHLPGLELSVEHAGDGSFGRDGIDGKLRIIGPGSEPVRSTAFAGLVVKNDKVPVFETVHTIGPDAEINPAHRYPPVGFLLDHGKRLTLPLKL